MPAVISLKTATVSQLYQAGGPPVSTTIYGQTLIDFAKDSRFGGLLFPNSIPVTALQNINASKITTQSLSGAIGGTASPGQLAWNTINTNNIAPSGIDTAAINNRAVTRHKIATESIFLEHFSNTSLSEFANKISTGEIAQKVNRAGDTMNGTLALSGTTGVIAVNQGAQGASIDIRSSTVDIDSNAAYMTFHRPSKYAVRFGLDSDNKLKVGGWSMGNFAYEIVNANNFDTYIGSSTKLSSDYVAKTGATMTGNLSIRQNGSSGYVSLVTGSITKPGYIAFFEPTGSRIGYIGWSSSNNTIDIKGESDYEFNFTTSPKIKGKDILSVAALQDPGVGAALLTGATSTYESGVVKEIYRTNTYLTLGPAGSNNDWAYLRQIGEDNNYHLALDVHDDGDDARFSLRSVKSFASSSPDKVNTHLTITPTKTTLYTDLDVIAGTPTGFTGEAAIRIQGNRTDQFNANRLVFGDQINSDRYWMGTRGDKDGSNAKFILYYYNTDGGANNYRNVLMISPNSINSNSYSLNLKDSALTIDSSNKASFSGDVVITGNLTTNLEGSVTLGKLLQLGSASTDNGDVRIEIGTGKVANTNNASTNTYIDLISEQSESNYNLRLYRYKGTNGEGGILKQGGTGALRINNVSNGGVTIASNNTVRLTVESNGVINCNGNTLKNIASPTADDHVIRRDYVGADDFLRRLGSRFPIQVVQGQLTAASSHTGNNTWKDIGLSVTIARKLNDSRIRIQAAISNSSTNGNFSNAFRIMRGTTPIGLGNAASNRTQVTGGGSSDYGGNHAMSTACLDWVDTPPNSTGDITYSIQVRSWTNVTAKINATIDDANANYAWRGVSTITVTELTP